MKRVVITGYYGVGNLGDDLALYYLVKNIFKILPKVKINVFFIKNGSVDCYKTLFNNDKKVRFYERSSVKNLYKIIKNCDVLIFGGGTCFHEGGAGALYEFLIAKLLKIKTLYLGVGIGKLLSFKSKLKCIFSMYLADLVAFRDLNSLNTALSLAPSRKEKLYLTADFVYLGIEDYLKLRSSQEKKINGTLLISWRDFGFWEVPSGYEQVLLKSLYKNILNICKSYEIKKISCLPLCDLDININKKIISDLRKILPSHVEINFIFKNCIFEKLSEIAKVNFFISARLHGLFLGRILNIPTIGFNYSPKIRYFADEIGENCVVSLEELLNDSRIIKFKLSSLKSKEIDKVFLIQKKKEAYNNIKYIEKILLN